MNIKNCICKHEFKGPYIHTSAHRGTVMWMNTQERSNISPSLTYHQVNTNTRDIAHTSAAGAHMHANTHIHIHTHAISPKCSTCPWMISGPYLPFQVNWVPLSPLLLSALLPFLGSLLSNAFAHSVPPAHHTLTLSHPSGFRFNITSSVGSSLPQHHVSFSYSIIHLV